MTPNELEAYDAMIADRDRWKERAERLESFCPSDATACSLSSLQVAATKYRKEHFQKYNADPTDQEARDGYYYEEGRTRAYSEGMNVLAEMERERIAYRDALKEIATRPGWQDPEVGFMSGHIARGVLNLFPENASAVAPATLDSASPNDVMAG